MNITITRTLLLLSLSMSALACHDRTTLAPQPRPIGVVEPSRVVLAPVARDGDEADGTRFEFESFEARRRQGGPPSAGFRWFPHRRGSTDADNDDTDAEGRWIYFAPTVWGRDGTGGFTEADMVQVRAGRDHREERTVDFTIAPSRQDAFARYTKSLVHRELALIVDGEVVVAPTVQSVIRSDVQISNGAVGFTEKEQEDLLEALSSR